MSANSTSPVIDIRKVDYNDPQQAAALVELLNDYAIDPMGGGEPLTAEVCRQLPQRLSAISHAYSWIAWVDGQPAGLVNVFGAFSTFKAKPILNIHDITVKKSFRGLGLSQKLLQVVEDLAREQGCCKVTLEVLSNNDVAKNAYQKFGFAGYELDPAAGHALFWQKFLD
ncbi:GNAT family N-acetyltransferase [Oceanobacter mangrovi]|uniref:GNAT family N-acetyltransferase n=1 Tax=Oceanobacter mangrovi TaxID=2862510 RepID=UPI001C8E5D17|nr:GNAT family N-acetyltransferase [Oceanobacter mangrovi]